MRKRIAKQIDFLKDESMKIYMQSKCIQEDRDTQEELIRIDFLIEKLTYELFIADLKEERKIKVRDLQRFMKDFEDDFDYEISEKMNYLRNRIGNIDFEIDKYNTRRIFSINYCY